MGNCRISVATARHALSLGGLLIVLAGLLGMHGLASHGAAGMGTTSHTMVSPGADGAMVAVAEPVTSVAAASAFVATTVWVGAGQDAAMGVGMAAMCMAILALALIAVLLLLQRIGGSRQSILWMRARLPRALGRPGRDPDPPSLITLSIQRC